MGALFFQNGQSIGSSAGWCGFTGNNNYVVRYDFRTGSEGASELSVVLSGIYYGSGAGTQPFGFKLSTGAGTWSNARNISPDSDLAYMSYSGAGGYGCTLHASGLNLLPDTQYYIFVYVAGSGAEYYSGWNCVSPIIACSGSYTAPGSAISSMSALVMTGSPLSLIMARSAGNYHQASFSYKGEILALSAPFESALSHICPREWMSRETEAESMEIEVSVQSYADPLCAVPSGEAEKGSFVLCADGEMRPRITQEAIKLRVINDGEASDFEELIAGISRLEVSFDRTLVDLSACAGAGLKLYRISCRGQSSESEESRLETGIIPGDGELVCSVVDSRGREGSVSLALSPLAYVPPSLIDMSALRCDENGADSEEGAFCRLRAGAVYTALDGKNSCSVSASIQPTGGERGEEIILEGFESGVWSDLWEKACILGGDMQGDSYTLHLSIRDALGSESRYRLHLYHQKWALKFNSDGTALGIGMAPTVQNALQLPDLWRVYAGMLVLSDRSYGYEAPEEKLESAVEGQLYFQLTEQEG